METKVIVHDKEYYQKRFEDMAHWRRVSLEEHEHTLNAYLECHGVSEEELSKMEAWQKEEKCDEFNPQFGKTKPPRMGKGIYISPEDKQEILNCADEIADYYHISTNQVRKNLWSYMKKYILENFANAKEDK